MKVIVVTLVVLSGLVQAELKSNGVTEIDLVLNGLNKQSWSQEESPCFKETVFLLENARNYTVWAMMIWNSMQTPMGTFYGTLYSLGSYDQCIKNTPINNNYTVTTQYCLADVKLTNKLFEERNRNVMSSSESYLGVTTKMKRDLFKITWGTCLPASCNRDSMAKIMKVIYMVNPVTPDEPSITIDHCQVAGEKREFTTAFYMFVSLIIGLITVILLSAYYVPYDDSNSTLTRFLECFSLQRNFLSLTKDLSDDDIPTLNLTKFFLSAAVVVVHSFYFSMGGPINNIITLDEIVRPANIWIWDLFIRNIDLTLEVYFIMSALFFMKGLMKKRRNPLVSILHRYFRLIGTYALVTFYILAVSMHMGDGPMWPKLAGREQADSSANWHWSFLLLNNYIGSKNFSLLISWYIHCDYQLTIMGAIIFMIWQKDKRFGKLFTILIFILSILTPTIVTYWKKLPGNLVMYDIAKVLDVRTNEVFLETYVQTQHRATSYLLGMGLGYIMTVYKPSKSRTYFSKKMSMFLIVLIFISGSLILGAVEYLCGENEVLTEALEAGLRRFIFGLQVCSWIMLIEYGNFTYLKEVAGQKVFTILSRLSYGIYMTHMVFIYHNVFSRRNPQHVTFIFEIIYGLGVWFTSIGSSIIVWFLVEAPISNIFSFISNLWRQSKSTNVVKSRKDMD